MSIGLSTLTQTILTTIARTGCPISGVSIGDPNDPATWLIQFDPAATQIQQNAATAAVAAINLTAITQLSQQGAILAAGLALTSTGTPALNATYGVDDATYGLILGEMIYILNSATFHNGTTTNLKWMTINGAIVTFPTIAKFKAYAGAVFAYRLNIQAVSIQLAAGTVVAWPLASATIA